MVPLRREKGVLAATIGILSSAILAPTASGRDAVPEARGPEVHGTHVSCSSLPNCYAVGRTSGFIADGAAARFDVRSYTAPDWQHDGHTNHALWVYVESSLEFCEIGWTKAYHGDASYRHYGAYAVNGEYLDFPIDFPVGSSGTTHHYQIHREYDGKYNLYIDNNDVQDCFANPFTLLVETGLEYTSPSAVAPVNDPRDLQWRRATDFAWFDWGSLSTSVTSLVYGSAARWNWEVYPTHGEDWTTN